MQQTFKNSFVGILSRCIHLDIFDLNFAYGSDTLGKKRLSLPKTSIHPRGIIYCIGSFFYHMLKSVKYIFSFLKVQAAKDSVLFFMSSHNQKHSLLPIKDKCEHSLLVGGSITSNLDVNLQFPLFWAHLISILFTPVLFFRFFTAREHRRESFFYDLDSYWLSYGYFIVAWYWLSNLKPRIMIFANDHSMAPRVTAHVAKDLSIPTIYIQHASVTDQFPPLIFDYAFLEGMDALLKYAKIGNSKTTVFLIGMPKSDDYLRFINKSQHVSAVGIGLNLRDRVECVNEICKLLRQEFPELEIWIRPHPRDRRQHVWNQIVKECNLKLSRPDVESSFDFLRKVDAIIAGNSNIVLEAALLDVYPIGYKFSGINIDWYGFSENVLLEYTSDPNNVIQSVGNLIKYKPSIRKKAKVYCGTIGTIYDGHSSQLAAKLISEIEEKAKVDLTIWQLLVGVSLEAYTLI